MDWIGGLGQAASAWDIFRRATGDAFLPTVALALLILLIVWGWRSPQLPWFTGRVALAMVVMLTVLLVVVVVLVAWNRRESQPAARNPMPSHVRPATPVGISPEELHGG